MPGTPPVAELFKSFKERHLPASCRPQQSTLARPLEVVQEIALGREVASASTTVLLVGAAPSVQH